MLKRRKTLARALRAAPSQGVVRLDRVRSMPLERSVAWGPALIGDARPSRPSAPGQIFITPDVLREVRAHVSREGGGSLGYFLGERFRDADSKEPWVLVDGVIPVAPSPGTAVGLLLDGTLELAQMRASFAGRHVVGWYHGAECSQPVLTASDAETHERHFAKTHSFMLMVAIGRQERQAALFRPSLERGPVPFYELLEPDSARTTAMSWSNYFTVEAVARESPTRVSSSRWAALEPPAPGTGVPPPMDAQDLPPARGEPNPSASQSLLARRTPTARARISVGTPAPHRGTEAGPVVPASRDTAPAEPTRADAQAAATPIAPPGPPARGSGGAALGASTPSHLPVATPNPLVEAWRPVQRPVPQSPSHIDRTVADTNPDPWWHVRAQLRPFLFAGLGIAMLAGLVGMAGVYAPALWPERQEPASVRPPVSPTLAWAGDAAGNAVMRYRAAAHLWNNRRMACAELGRHLVSVDEAWITYSIERGALSEALDTAGVERERTLEGDVTSVEQHFHTTGCPRP